jgi:hypothetical protein
LTKPKFVLVLCIAGWFIVYGFLLTPQLGTTDTYYFKDAGANLALGNGFASRLTFGNPTTEFRLLAHYPPVYGVTFAGFSSLFGVGPRQNTLHNLAIAAMTAVLAFFVLRWRDPDRRFGFYNPAILALTCIAVPLSFYGAERDRADAMGLSAAIAALLVLAGAPSLRRYFISAIIAGLALEISPICGVLAASGIAVLWLARWVDGASGAHQPLKRVLPLVVAGAVICPLLFQSIMVAVDPTSLQRLTGVMLGTETARETGSGYFLALLQGDWRTYLSAFTISDFGHRIPYLKLACVAAMLLAYCLRRVVSGAAPRRVAMVLPIFAVTLLPILLVPYQGNYVGLAAGFILLLFVVAVVPRDTVGQLAGRLAALGGFVALVALSLPSLGHDVLYGIQLGPSLNRMRATLTTLVAGRPELRSQLMAVSPAEYMLFKQMGFNVVTTSYPPLSDAELRQPIEFYALNYAGSGNPAEPQYPPWWDASSYKSIFKPELPQRTMLFGRPVSNSSVTWEVALYARASSKE